MEHTIHLCVRLQRCIQVFVFLYPDNEFPFNRKWLVKNSKITKVIAIYAFRKYLYTSSIWLVQPIIFFHFPRPNKHNDIIKVSAVLCFFKLGPYSYLLSLRILYWPSLRWVWIIICEAVQYKRVHSSKQTCKLILVVQGIYLFLCFALCEKNYSALTLDYKTKHSNSQRILVYGLCDMS